MIPEDKYEVSPVQLGMLIHSSDRGSGAYIQQMVCSLREDLNVGALVKAWDDVVSRHPIFRTSFHIAASPPFQRVHAGVNLAITQEDWSTMATRAQETSLETYLANDRQHSFEPGEAPSIRIAIIRMGPAHYEMVWTSHHALMDGRSRRLVLKELFSLYEAYQQGAHLELKEPRPYADYIRWLKNYDLVAAEKFWREELRGFEAPTFVDVGGGRSKDAERISHTTAETYLSERLTIAMKQFAARVSVTLNTVVQASWSLLLSRYTGEYDIVFGATRACRRSSITDAESMIGLFINTLPVRVRISADELTAPWLQRLRASQVAVRPYEHTPLTKILEWSEVPRGTSLFESIVVFENDQFSEAFEAQGGNWKQRKFRLIEQTNYPLVLSAFGGERLLLKLEADETRFDHAAITRMLVHFETLLEGIVSGPEQRIGALPMLGPAEMGELMEMARGGELRGSYRTCLHELFQEQVEQSPENVALVYEGTQLTYCELNERANQLAHYLRRAGVGAEALVGICLERSLEMVIGLLGILKSGGAYVPLDPTYPAERLRLIVAEAGIAVVLTAQRFQQIFSPAGVHSICLDVAGSALAAESSENPTTNTIPANLAYVIYTSGSTGKPKGSMISHEGICNRLQWMQETYQLTEADRVLQKTPFTFDVSVWEFFWPLLTGARLVVARPGSHGDSGYLVDVITQQGITTMHFVPSMLAAFLEDSSVSKCGSLRRVICSGEALSWELKERFRQQLAAELHNLYGPTEASVDVTYWNCSEELDRPLVPIGRPIANTQIHVLDKHLGPVPVGVAGELYIGGIGLARGYLGRADLTAERFVPHPFGEKGERLYRTGDLARYLADGNIEYLGRTDHQVKLRGFRIELGEIEAALNQHPAVCESVVTVCGNKQEDRRLVAYCVGTSGSQPMAGELQADLKRTLPDYMVPTTFVFIDQMPLTSSGKINRRALPQPEARDSGTIFEAPRTNTEEKLAAMWTSILKLERVGIHDNFFRLGGHSLLAFQLISRVRDEFKVELPLTRVFEAPTVADLSRWICEEADRGPSHTDSSIKALSRQRRTRASGEERRVAGEQS